ncbi:MAG: hypothetical protein ACYDC3_10715 [Candidatus Binataceae bacterium]
MLKVDDHVLQAERAKLADRDAARLRTVARIGRRMLYRRTKMASTDMRDLLKIIAISDPDRTRTPRR